MKRLFFLLICTLAAGTLSCSKPQAPPPVSTPVPTATPLPAVVSIDLGPAATPDEAATPEPLEYVLEDLKGTVLIRENGETQAEPAEEEETVEAGDEIITQAASEASLTLDENTMFHLPENSDVQVDQLKPNTSNGFLCRLMLLGGKVLSEVEKLGENHSTFEVEAGGVVCGVRGTAFEVQKEGQTIHTFTYHGEVEMRKGNLVQPVVAGHHSAFLFQKGAFQPPRPLRPAERQTYQGWLKKKAVVQRKQAQRLAAIRSLSNLPPEQRKRVMENLKGAKPRDRMRMMHQMLKSPSQTHPGPGPARLRQGQPLKGNRPNRRGGNGFQNKGAGIKGGIPHTPALKPKGKNQNPKLQKPGTPHQNLQNGNKNLARPQGQKPRPALRPNRPLQKKPQNQLKAQPRKPGQLKPNGQKKGDQKKGKKKKDQGK